MRNFHRRSGRSFHEVTPFFFLYIPLSLALNALYLSVNKLLALGSLFFLFNMYHWHTAAESRLFLLVTQINNDIYHLPTMRDCACVCVELSPHVLSATL